MGLYREGYIPVFPDTAPDTVNFSPETIESCISDRTRAILCVHKTGTICDMDPIVELACNNDLIVYEDACQAVFGKYKGRLAGTLSMAGGFSFDSEKTMGADVGGCVITNDDDLAERMRYIGHSRGAVSRERFGRVHKHPGYAYRMPECTAAISLAQLEIIQDQVDHIDKMVRLITDLTGQIEGITPLPIPDYMDVYSAWMFGMSIDPEQFTCDADDFAAQLVEEGIPGAGTGKYYLMPEACDFLKDDAAAKRFPFSMPPASREYTYGGETTPVATAFLQNWIRWSTFCEKYTEDDCQLAAAIVNRVADNNRR
jgi:dTDP-4-amino-4,6-dideoxygalactose transaminase